MKVVAGQSADVAIPELVREHGGAIYGLAVRLCGHRADAEDLVQDVFLQAYRKWDQFEGRADPKTWLYTIAARACRRKRRRKSGEPRRVGSIEELMPAGRGMLADVGGGAGPVDEAMRGEAMRAVEGEISRLPDLFRLPLVLKDVLELPVADVAAALGIKPETVKTRVHRARLMLRKALDRRLPRREVPGVIYEKQVCMDLLRAKQEALDSGRGFPVGSKVMCARCRAVFAGMDLARDVCVDLARGELPAELREAVMDGLARVGVGGGGREGGAAGKGRAASGAEGSGNLRGKRVSH